MGPFRKLAGSRRSLFEQLDRPALRPLPAERYVFAQWKKTRVNIDYHVEVDGDYYSVPHALIRRQREAQTSSGNSSASPSSRIAIGARIP